MASPVAVRQPLSQRSINTQSFYPLSNNPTSTTTSTTTVPSSTYKPHIGQKRTHSQSTGQENTNTNVQQQILGSAAAFKQPSLPRHPPYVPQAAAQKSRTTTDVRSRPVVVQVQPQFKQPLPRTATLARQRQQTNDPAATGAEEGDTEEVIEWRRQMKRTLSVSTFYFDCVEESFKDAATRIILKQGGKVEQFFSNSVNIIITTREIPPPPTFAPNLDSTSKQIKSKTESFKGNLNHVGSPPPQANPVKDILFRARDLGIRIWPAEKFKRILQCVSPVVRSSPQTINPFHLSAALEAEKRHGRTTETDPSVPREEYVYFQGPYILVTDLANVHKPIMMREFPAGSDRPKGDDGDSLWPMFWAGREGSCPFIRPVNRPNNSKPGDAVGGDPAQKHYARANIVGPSPVVVLGENRHVGNRMMVLEQPASGIINSSNAFSAIRSTTTCGSNITSTLSALGGGGGGGLSATHTSLPRPVRDLKSRLTTIPPQREEMPPPKKRRVETLREQLAKTKKKPAKEGYCENCKERYDEYEEHTQTRRHRKYARNDKNFVHLDELLEKLRRPLLGESRM